MDDGIKQRLVGAVVLVAVGVIFVPSLLNQEGRREVDVATQVPPEPVVVPRPLEINDPMPVENLPTPKPIEQSYRHIEDGNPDASNASETTIASEIPVEGELEVSGLDEEGIPYAWSVQVSSFESEKNAKDFEKKLQEAGYTAYTQSAIVSSGQVHRVFVGPKINRQTAEAVKKEIDKAYKTQALLVEFSP